ncbi:MAG: putative glycosyltransferase EpsJ [Bacteroidota bacterium]|jgi:glycosyltransferase involved in cell wall biosynthesis
MKISVIIPAWNAQETIAQTLESLVAQQRQADEVVLVNDGSTDRTREIVEGFADRLPLVIIDQGNGGLGKARNSGIDAASGHLLAFLDADDLWSWNRLALVERFVQKHDWAQWFYSPVYNWFAGKERRMFKRSCPQINSLDHFLATNSLVPSSVIIRSTMDFRWEERRDQVEDLGPFVRLLKSGNLPKLIPHTTVKYRIDAGLTQNLEQHFALVFNALEELAQEGVLDPEQCALYKARKAYEACRTFKKRGAQKEHQQWVRQFEQQSKHMALPLSLRLKMALLGR